MTVRALLLALCVLVCVPSAAAHPGGPKGFESTVLGHAPAARGLAISMLGGDDQVLLRNETGKELVIKGYENEPYLRFSADGVYQNDRSPAVYLNADRFANLQPPPKASAKAPPEWKKILPGDAFKWHDHRAHWMSPIPPPKIQQDPDRRHHVFDWKIAAELEGKPLTIRGTLDYVPPPDSGGPRWWLLAVLLSLAGVGALGAFALYQRQARTRS